MSLETKMNGAVQVVEYTISRLEDGLAEARKDGFKETDVTLATKSFEVGKQICQYVKDISSIPANMSFTFADLLLSLCFLYFTNAGLFFKLRDEIAPFVEEKIKLDLAVRDNMYDIQDQISKSLQ